MSRRDLIVVAVIAIAIDACKCKSDLPATSGAPGGKGGIAGAAPPLATKEYFRVDPGPRTPCTPDAACEARVVVTALGDYHVNERYPTKLIADPAPGVKIDGTGTFALDSKTVGTLTLPYRARRGTHRITATVKLSVCNDKTCKVEEPKIELELTAG